jgi:hypothetical protein
MLNLGRTLSSRGKKLAYAVIPYHTEYQPATYRYQPNCQYRWSTTLLFRYYLFPLTKVRCPLSFEEAGSEKKKEKKIVFSACMIGAGDVGRDCSPSPPSGVDSPRLSPTFGHGAIDAAPHMPSLQTKVG